MKKLLMSLVVLALVSSSHGMDTLTVSKADTTAQFDSFGDAITYFIDSMSTNVLVLMDTGVYTDNYTSNVSEGFTSSAGNLEIGPKDTSLPKPRLPIT